MTNSLRLDVPALPHCGHNYSFCHLNDFSGINTTEYRRRRGVDAAAVFAHSKLQHAASCGNSMSGQHVKWPSQWEILDQLVFTEQIKVTKSSLTSAIHFKTCSNGRM